MLRLVTVSPPEQKHTEGTLALPICAILILTHVWFFAIHSMPGMMNTVLDLGLCDANVDGLAKKAGKRFAYDCYR